MRLMVFSIAFTAMLSALACECRQLPEQPAPTLYYTVGGTVTGLNGILVLQNNDGDDLSLDGNGPFAFPTPLVDVSAYDVTILTQPDQALCTIVNATGTLDTHITNVDISCISTENLKTVGGQAKNVVGAVTISLNGEQDLTLTADGQFTFPMGLQTNATYAVTITTQPDTQVCSIKNGGGKIKSADIINVIVDCVDNLYTVGGSVIGLTGIVTLRINGGNSINVSGDNDFTFIKKLIHNEAYEVTVFSKPPALQCAVTNGTGNINAANVTDVTITCSVAYYTVGGKVLGATGPLTIQNNGGDDLNLAGDGVFTFATTLQHTNAYDVTILTHPTDQECFVRNGTGNINGNHVTTVDVVCGEARYAVGGSITGLIGHVIVRNNGSDSMVLYSTTGDPDTWKFVDEYVDATPYDVTIFSYPIGQTCSVTNGSGTISGADITDIDIVCDWDYYYIGGTVTGLVGTLTLENNANSEVINISSDGTYQFPTGMVYGTTFRVIMTQPGGSVICKIVNASGTIISYDILNIDITCASYTLMNGQVIVSGITAATSPTLISLNTDLSSPFGATSDGFNVYFPDYDTSTWNYVIKKYDPSTGDVTTFSGDGNWDSDDGPYDTASFSYPRGITCDGSYLYVTDMYNYAIRKIDISDGSVTTLTNIYNYTRGIVEAGSYVYVGVTGSWSNSEPNAVFQVHKSTGATSLYAGQGSTSYWYSFDGNGTSASIYRPRAMTSVTENELYIVTGDYYMMHVDLSSADCTIIGSTYDQAFDMSSDGEYLYLGSRWGSQMQIFDLSTNSIDYYGSGVGDAAGVAWVGTSLIVADRSSSTLYSLE